MPNSRLLSLGLASLAAASLLLTACSTPSGGGDDKLTYKDSPLFKYTSAMYGGDKSNEEYIAEGNAVEELVATCMANEGFDYLPVDNSQYYTNNNTDDVDRNTEEWVAANGYGYNLTDDQQAEQNGQGGEIVDPNSDYVMSLSESEQTAYYEVLYGPQPTEEEMNDPDFEYQQLGCNGEAYKQINGSQVAEDPQFKGIIEEMSKLWEKQAQLPAVKKLNVAWSSCMADAGHADLPTKDSVYDLMNAQNEEAWADGSEGPSPEKRAEMRKEEIDLALADFHCSEGLNYEQIVLAAQFDLEKKFIADHQAELDAMLAAANGSK